MRLPSLVIAIGTFLFAGESYAQKADNRSRLVPVLPRLSITGATTGDASFSAGADLVFGVSDSLDVGLLPFVSTSTTNGLATLFSATDEDVEESSGPWKAGVGVDFYWLPGGGVGETRRIIRAQIEKRAEIYSICAAICTARKERADCESFLKVDQSSFAPATEACNEGRDEWLGWEKPFRRDVAGVYPVLTLSAAYAYGRETFKFLAPLPDSALLSSQEESRGSHKFGLAVTYLPEKRRAGSYGLTYEFNLALGLASKASQTSAEWCVPAGLVQRGEGPDADEARSCTTRAVGAPTQAWQGAASFLVGGVDRLSDDFRFAIGPRLVRSGRNMSLGVELPLYVGLAAFPAEYAGSYKGVLRVAPRADWSVHGDGFAKFQFTLALELLAQRNLLARAVDFVK